MVKFVNSWFIATVAAEKGGILLNSESVHTTYTKSIVVPKQLQSIRIKQGVVRLRNMIEIFLYYPF